ncbi:MAG: Rrf2 family transcriptional regulator [candidate division WOR-3 bacterium]
MKLSTKGRYAARAMLELAIGYGDEFLSIKEIAKREEVSERYLENIMNKLTSSGLVISLRGKNGGFRLAKKPREITLAEVINVVEGSLSPTDCVDRPEICKRVRTCVTYEIWQRLKKAMEEILNGITLEDMVQMYKKKSIKEENLEFLYYI